MIYFFPTVGWSCLGEVKKLIYRQTYQFSYLHVKNKEN